ncbi:MAG: squalene synthase HpnC [Comamonadaceae bacterium]|nr:MAG: squalene synthase HpnC [Comamonadaceae bacterium]
MAVDHYENFPVASLLLPRHLKRAVRDIYRFARSADDLADEGEFSNATRLANLGAYRTELYRIGSEPIAPFGPANPGLANVFAPLAHTISTHQLPITPFFDLLSAFEQDVIQKRYSDYDSLLDYCSHSANPVGRLMLHLHQAATPSNIERSDAICTALQLTNMWQDVQNDWRRGRVYIPQEDLDRFEVTELDMQARTLSERWSALMAFEIERTRALLNFGAPLARALPGRVGFELRLVVEGARRILQRIEANQYDVFMNRPTLAKSDWALMLWRATVSYDT